MYNQSSTITDNADDHFNTTCVFGEVKKTILSKNFKTGKVNMLFGSTLIDFSYADINGLAILDISQAFGETIVRVPQNWRVETDLSQFCAAVEDRRWTACPITNSDKILLIQGLSTFAAVEISTL
jgi:hypothetical protein